MNSLYVGIAIVVVMVFSFLIHIDTETVARNEAIDRGYYVAEGSRVYIAHANALRIKIATPAVQGELDLSTIPHFNASGIRSCADANSVTTYLQDNSGGALTILNAVRDGSAPGIQAGLVSNNEIQLPAGNTAPASCAVPNLSVAIKSVM